jgi:hypothetical protein
MPSLDLADEVGGCGMSGSRETATFVAPALQTPQHNTLVDDRS